MFISSRGARRVFAVVAVVLSIGLAAPAHAADSRPPTTNRAAAAAGWLASQLVDGNHMATDFGGVLYDDPGLTADAILAFAAAGVAGDAGKRATTWLFSEGVLPYYIGDGVNDLYAGATAKAALVAITQGRNPKKLGGVNLIARLGSRLQENGRYTDLSIYGDFSNGIGQSLAVLAQARLGSVPPRAVNFLAASRCEDGGTPIFFDGDCFGSVDATAFAVQALLAVGRTADAAVGVQFLLDQQLPDGSFGNPANANTTGLAATALRVAGEDDAADAAAAFLKKLQKNCKAPEDQRGAVRYEAGSFDPATAPRATAQAIGGLAGVGLFEASSAASTPESASLACPV